MQLMTDFAVFITIFLVRDEQGLYLHFFGVMCVGLKAPCDFLCSFDNVFFKKNTF
jgi:hypothetical protein